MPRATVPWVLLRRRRLFFSAMPLDLQSYLVKGRGTDARVPMDAVPLVEQALEWSKGKAAEDLMGTDRTLDEY